MGVDKIFPNDVPSFELGCTNKCCSSVDFKEPNMPVRELAAIMGVLKDVMFQNRLQRFHFNLLKQITQNPRVKYK